MKQLRVISNTESQADFNVLFQEPIVLKPNSTIGLQNFSLFFDDEIIEVNEDNNTFTMEFFDVDDAEEKMFGTFSLAVGTYNAQQFIDQLNFALNKGLANLSSAYGGELIQTGGSPNYMEISCILDKTTKNLSITYALQSRDINPDYLTMSSIQYDGFASYNKSLTSPFDWAFAYTDRTLCDGQADIHLVTSDAGGTTTGIAMGVINLNALSPQQLLGDGLEPSLYVFCVFNDDGTFWKIKYPNGSIVTTTRPVTNSDVLFISKGAYSTDLANPANFNQFGYNITITTGMVGFSVAQIPFDYGQQYHGAFSIRDDTSEIQNFAFTPSPSNVADKYGSGIHIVKDFRLLEKNNYYTKNIGGDPQPPYQKLLLNLGNNVAQLLGFNDPITQSITGSTGSWDADISIYSTIIPSSIIIELPNTHIHSYDGDVYYKRRRNILAIIPAVNLEQENTKISYVPPFPVMLDMLNKNEELLTNIRVRVLDLDNVPLRINTNKGVSLSVLIQ